MSKSRSAFTLVLLAGAALSIAACNKEDSTRAAIRKASTDLGAVSGGAASPTTNAHQQKLYDDASKAAQSAGGSGASAAAANLISATAAEGKASVPEGHGRTAVGGADMSEDAGVWKVTEIGIFNRMSSLRSHLTRYMEHKQIAAAAALFNPSEQIAALDKASATLDQALVERAQAKGELEAKIAALAANVKTKNDAGAKLDEQSGTLRKKLSELSATNAAPVVEQAAGLKRQADRARQEAQLIDADASQLRAQLPELQLAVRQIDAQKKGIAQTKADLAAKVAFNTEQASNSNAEAAKVVAAVEAEIADLKKAREGGWARSNDERLALLRQALGNAQKASADAPLQAKLTTGSVQQAIGDLHLGRAVEARAYGLLMGLLGTSNPSLPKADEYKSESGNADKAREEAALAAKEAYEAAKSAYSTAPVRGSKDSADVKARLEKLGNSLDAVIQALSSGSNASLKEFGFSDAPATATPPAAANPAKPAPAAEAPAASTTPPELLAAIDAFLAASKAGDSAKILSMSKATSPTSQQLLAMMTSMGKLDAACKAKFGKTFSESMKGAGMQMLPDMSAAEGVTASSMKFKVDGGKATTQIGAAAITFVNEDGDWKFDMDGMAAQATANPMMAGMLPKLGPAIESLTADVESGKIATIGAVQAQLMAKIMGGAAGGPDK